MKKIPLKQQINTVREEIARIDAQMLALRGDDEFTPPPMASVILGARQQAIDHPADERPAKPEPDYSEMAANLTLAHRHLEDARMRLGKVIQASDGGVSIYDR